MTRIQHNIIHGLKVKLRSKIKNTYITISRNALYNGLKYIYIPYKTFLKIEDNKRFKNRHIAKSDFGPSYCVDAML